jgi:hypothetical protein
MAAVASAQDKPPDYIVSTGKFWEARLVSTQYGEIVEKENQSARITLKGKAPSAAVVLSVKCTALLDQNKDLNSFDMLSSVPSVWVGDSRLEKVAVAVEQTLGIGAPAFAEMRVYTIFGEGTGVYLSGLKVKGGQSIPILFGYELPAAARAILQKSPTLTIDYRNTEVRLPVTWPPEGPKK